MLGARLGLSSQEIATLIIPSGAGGGFSNSRSAVTDGRTYQTCYNARNFAAAGSELISIVGIAYRADEGTSDMDVTFPNLQIWMSTFTNEFSQLAPFASRNYGADRILVFSSDNVHFMGERDLANPRNFQFALKLQTPFLYDPKRGHLLLDVQSDDPAIGTLGASLDATALQGDLVSSIRGAAGQGIVVPGVGDVLELSYVHLPEVAAPTTNIVILPEDGRNAFSNAKSGLTTDESYQLCYNSRNFSFIGREVGSLVHCNI